MSTTFVYDSMMEVQCCTDLTMASTLHVGCSPCWMPMFVQVNKGCGMDVVSKSTASCMKKKALWNVDVKNNFLWHWQVYILMVIEMAYVLIFP
jgi:hypothetical protein